MALESRFLCQLFSRRRHRKVFREGWRRSLRLRGLPPEYTELPILIRRTRRGKPVLEIVRDEFCLTDWLYLNFIERKGSNNLNTSASTSGKNSQRPSWPCNVAESAWYDGFFSKTISVKHQWYVWQWYIVSSSRLHKQSEQIWSVIFHLIIVCQIILNVILSLFKACFASATHKKATLFSLFQPQLQRTKLKSKRRGFSPPCWILWNRYWTWGRI